MRKIRTLLFAAMMVPLSASALAQKSPTAPPDVTSMKLLSPRIGWALTAARRVFWTMDNGADWKDISPPERLGEDEHVCDVFFLDAHNGWVLFSKFDEPDPEFELASTGDTGATWSLRRVRPDLGKLATHGRIAFADRQHGWIVINTATSSAFMAGALFATSDGGRTWRSPPDDPGGQGPMLLMTPRKAGSLETVRKKIFMSRGTEQEHGRQYRCRLPRR